MNADTNATGIRIIPPLVYLVGLLIGLLIGLWLPTAIIPSAVAWTLGAILIAGGLALMAWALRLFLRTGTPFRPDRAATALVIAGPYRYTRNPMYVGLAGIYLGLAVGFQSLWAVLLLPVVLYVIWREAILKEEAFLAHKFGADYTRYKESVRRWI
jgi:protein-S-isoprenylcysteine O-methyltransferase Ste14